MFYSKAVSDKHAFEVVRYVESFHFLTLYHFISVSYEVKWLWQTF